MNNYRIKIKTERFLLYVPSVYCICFFIVIKHGAGDGNRTHATGLGSQGSAIELHPPDFEIALKLAFHSLQSIIDRLHVPSQLNGNLLIGFTFQVKH